MKKILAKLTKNRLLSSFLAFFMGAEMDLTSIAVAYYLLISIFPILMTLANLLPYLQIDVDWILQFLQDVFPAKLYPTVKGIVTSVLTRPSSTWLGVSIVTTLWTFSRSMNALQKAVNKAYGVDEHRDMIIGQLVSILLSIGLQVFLSLSILLMTFGKMVLHFLQHYLHLNQKLYYELLDWTQPAIYVSLFLALVMLYFFLPNVKIRKIRYVMPGAIFVTGTLALVGNLFASYVTVYADRLLNFRLVTSVIFLVLMLWFVFLAQILILGAVLNATYQRQHVPAFETRRGDVSSVVQKIKEKVSRTEPKLPE